MCRSKMAIDASQPMQSPRTPRRAATARPANSSRRDSKRTSSSRLSQPPQTPRSPLESFPSTSNTNYSSASSYRLDSSTATSSISGRTSLTSLRDSLPENANIYDFSEIRSATNNFLAKRYANSSTPCWRCTLRGKDVIVFQRKFRLTIETSDLKDKLSSICRSHHTGIIKLLGASKSGNFIYLAYEFINGGNLSDCLRNDKNPEFTVLSTWMSRIQIATDLAHALDYIHNNTGLKINLVHKYVKSSSIVITEPSFNGKICHFGAAELCGETATDDWKSKEAKSKKSSGSDEITEVDTEEAPSELRRSNSRSRQFDGVRGYMSPEFQRTGLATQKSDVYAFGIIILELLSGEEPLKYRFDKTSKEYRKISIIDTAKDTIEGDSGGEGVEGRLRKWVDRRLKDSFPVEVVGNIARVALECVHVDPNERPNMRRVAGKISKLYLQSRIWSDQVRVPTEISVSLGPR